MIKYSYLFIMSLLLVACDVFSKQTNDTDSQLSNTEVVSQKEDRIVTYFENSLSNPDEPIYFYRKLLGKNKNGDFIVQDFYRNSHRKFTDPYILKKEKDLFIVDFKQFITQSTNGKLISWHENGQKLSEANFVNGRLKGKSIIWDENGQKENEYNF
ncbi:toxin-antitoxin system YwqK family antitoxin [Neisseria sp. Ec49-e6-T10]|uniref:toxin-antitoxin system YwqK family antitoxin n=1 Tax=Neisseria sp. Ec49-e6-T10 TaxID=3140744 RepID=UPI003EBAEB2E